MFVAPTEEQQTLYRSAFVRNCMTIIVRSHVNLDRTVLKTAEEPHITGELVKTARALLESEHAESWMEHVEILDDPPQNLLNRHGKSRPRIDIEFVRTMHGRRPRFHIEAKRLYRSDSVNEYFGAAGLQMLVDGTYASEWPSAGMIGYVQSDSCSTWATRLADGFMSRRTQLAVCAGRPAWGATGWVGDGLDSVQSSCHERTKGDLSQIEVYHLLLDFMK